MDRIATILVIVDPTAERQVAVDKAATLALKLGAAIELLGCDAGPLRAGSATADAGINAMPGAELPQLLDRLAQPLRARGVEVAAHAIGGEPLHAKLLEWIGDSAADFVIKDTHHHSLAERLVMTNTDWHLIRGCRVPLLLVKPPPWRDPPVLLAAVDPGHANDRASVLDRRILDVATAIGHRLGGTVHAAHSYFPSTITTVAAGGMPPMLWASADALRAENSRRRAAILTLAAEYGVAEQNLHVEPAAPTEYIPRIAADCAADVVVMGALSRSGMKQALIGSTAERVLESIRCDVLVVKPADFAAIWPF